MVNVDDETIRKIDFHHTWSPDTIRADGFKYGARVVFYYVTTGELVYNEEGLDPVYAIENERNNAIRDILENFEGEVFEVQSMEKTFSEIDEYLSSLTDIADTNFMIVWNNYDSYLKKGNDYGGKIREIFVRHGFHVSGYPYDDDDVYYNETSLASSPFREIAPVRIVYYGVRWSERLDSDGS